MHSIRFFKIRKCITRNNRNEFDDECESQTHTQKFNLNLNVGLHTLPTLIKKKYSQKKLINNVVFF